MPHNEQPNTPTWKDVACPKFHALGDRLAKLEAIQRGDEICQGKQARPSGQVEAMLAGERESCLRGQMEMVMRALGYSLQSVLTANPQLGDECELRVVVLRCGVDDDVQYGIDLGRRKALEEARKN